MDPRRISKGKGKGGGKAGSPNNGTNVSAYRGLGQTTVAECSFTTPTEDQPKQRERTMSNLVSSSIQGIENSVQTNPKLHIDEEKVAEVLQNIITPITKAHDAGKNQ
jgi:hypothetical protein